MTPRATSRRHLVVDSPVGPLTLVAEDDALVGLYLDPHRDREGALGDAGDGAPASSPPFTETISQLEEYFAGDRTTFSVPLAPHGTAFQEQVWAALQDIPYGQTRTYGQLAAAIGRPTASRAVGLANGRNPVSIIVPCHRVIGADGSLTGYGGGLEGKRALLDLERRRTHPQLEVATGGDVTPPAAPRAGAPGCDG